MGLLLPLKNASLLQVNVPFFDWAWQCKIFYHSIGSPYNSAFFAEIRSQDALEGLRTLGLALSDYFLFSCFGLVASDVGVVGVGTSGIFCATRPRSRLAAP